MSGWTAASSTRSSTVLRRSHPRLPRRPRRRRPDYRQQRYQDSPGGYSQDSYSQGGYQQGGYQKHGRRPKKKEHWLSEIFD